MKRSVLELFKNIVIALLLCNILVLVLLALPGDFSGFADFDRLFSDYARLPEGEAIASSESIGAELALPMVISVNRPAGRTSVRRDRDAVKESYEQLGRYLADALTSAKNGTVLTDFPPLTDKTGVLFSYGGTMPAQALAFWLGGGESAAAGAYTNYLLACEGSAVTLYAVEGDRCLQYETAVSADSLTAALAEYAPDGSSLAGVRNDRIVHPLTLWENDVRVPAYHVENPLWDEYAAELAVALDFNPYGSGTYTEADGSTVYTEGTRSLTISPDGRVSFAAAEENYTRFTAENALPSSLAELTKQLTELVLSDMEEDGYLQLYSLRQEGRETTLSFCWCLDGTPIFPVFAEAVFSDAALQRFTCLLRTYRRQAGILTAMPIAQTSVLAESGTQLLPAYRLSSTDSLSLGWKEVN